VTLVDAGRRKIAVIKEVRELTGLGLSQAKSLVDGAPSIVLFGVDRQLASLAERTLMAVGEDVHVRISSSGDV
jgi:large subunit ribosomal protein L7/L12